MAPSSMRGSSRGGGLYPYYQLILLNFYINPDFLADLPFVDVEHIVRCFDKTTKLHFRKAEEPQYIKFGSTWA